MKIGIISNGYPPTAYGGVEGYSYQIANELKERGIRTFVLCRESNTDQPDYKVIRDSQNEILIYRIINDFKKINQFEGLYKSDHIDNIFRRVIKEENPDLLYFNHLIGLSSNLPNIAHNYQVPFIFNVHDYWPICHRINLINSQNQICYGPRNGGNCYLCLLGESNPQAFSFKLLVLLKRILPFRVRRALKKLFGRPSSNFQLPDSPLTLNRRFDDFKAAIEKSEIILTPSQFVKKILVDNGYLSCKIKVLPLGIDIGKTPKREKNNNFLNFAYIGTVLPNKGVDILVNAFCGIDNPNIRLQIFGRMDIDFGYAEKIKSLTEKDPRISLNKPFQVSEKDRVYENIDFIVVPSVWHETYSLVAREAMARNIPVIASENGALMELIKPFENGLLFPIGDIESLRNTMKIVIESPELVNRMKSNLSKMSFISIAQHVDELLELFQFIHESKTRFRNKA